MAEKKKRHRPYVRLAPEHKSNSRQWQQYYCVYIDDVEVVRTTHRYGNTRHPISVVGEADRAMRKHPHGKVCQIVWHKPVDSKRDRVLFTFRNKGVGKWRIAPKHLEIAA